MIKRFVTILLLCAFLLPLAAEAIASDTFKQNLHQVFEQHHTQIQHHHHANHHKHDHGHKHADAKKFEHPPVTLGTDAYFSDYLHVDIATHNSTSTQYYIQKQTTDQDTHPAALLSYHYGIDFSPGQRLSPPDMTNHIAPQSGRHLYLQTLRLRN